MGQVTKIEWTHHTFNPWIGCQKVSDGCKFCYAEALMDKRWGKVEWGPNGTRARTSDANWRQPLAWDRAAGAAGERRRVFCASLADVFEDRDELRPWRADLFCLIERCRNLDWLLLTKRPENINRMIADGTGRLPEAGLADCKHVWCGTSIESRATLDRIMPLAACPAAVRFVSFEPLLEDLGNIRGYLEQGVHWAIIGGESGPGARPFVCGWGKEIVRQCAAAGVICFVKQLGSNARNREGVRHVTKDPKGGNPAEWPVELRIREFPGADARKAG